MAKIDSNDKSILIAEDDRQSSCISAKGTAYIACCSASGTWLGQFFTRWFVAPNIAGAVFDGVREQTYDVLKNVTLNGIENSILGYVPGNDFLVSGMATEFSFQAAELAYNECIKLIADQGMVIGGIVGTAVGVGSSLIVGGLYQAYKQRNRTENASANFENNDILEKESELDLLTNNLAKLSIS